MEEVVVWAMLSATVTFCCVVVFCCSVGGRGVLFVDGGEGGDGDGGGAMHFTSKGRVMNANCYATQPSPCTCHPTSSLAGSVPHAAAADSSKLQRICIVRFTYPMHTYMHPFSEGAVFQSDLYASSPTRYQCISQPSSQQFRKDQ